jgi:hypothetical protein
MNTESTFVAEFEVTFSSYEAIKIAVAEYCQNDYKIDPVESFEREYKMHELSDACVFEFRNCVYMIKPSLETPTKFMVSSHTYWDATDLECFKACLTCLLSDLCEWLAIKQQESVREEDYYDKQFEDYLRLNPVKSLEEEEVVADKDNDALVNKYIEVDHKKNICDDDDIYVYDGVNIYE